jgi:hypothetical protein
MLGRTPLRKAAYVLAHLPLWLLGPNALAHHSFAAEFDYEATGTIEGDVIEVFFVNPHVRYFVAVVDADGNEVIWDTQTSSVSALTRYGWTKDTIRLGDKVTMQGNLGRDNTHKLWIREVVKEDGTIIKPIAGGAEPSDRDSESSER